MQSLPFQLVTVIFSGNKKPTCDEIGVAGAPGLEPGVLDLESSGLAANQRARKKEIIKCCTNYARQASTYR